MNKVTVTVKVSEEAIWGGMSPADVGVNQEASQAAYERLLGQALKAVFPEAEIVVMVGGMDYVDISPEDPEQMTSDQIIRMFDEINDVQDRVWTESAYIRLVGEGDPEPDN